MVKRCIGIVISILLIGCAPATPEAIVATVIPTETPLATETVQAMGTPETESAITEVAPTPAPTPTRLPTIDLDFIQPALSLTLPRWSPANAQIDLPAEAAEGALGAPLPPGAIERIGLGSYPILRLSPDGQLLALSTHAQIAVLRADTLDLIWAASLPRERISLAWSPDGATLITWMRGDHRLAFFDAASGQLINVVVFPNYPKDAAWSPDGSEIAVVYGLDEYADGFDADTSLAILNPAGVTLRTFPIPDYEYGTDTPLTVRWSPDATLIAVGAQSQFLLYSAGSGEVLIQTDAFRLSEILEFNPTGTILAVGSGMCCYGSDAPYGHNDFQLWDMQSLEVLNTPATSLEYASVVALQWSPDGMELLSVSGSGGYDMSEIIVWNLSGDRLYSSGLETRLWDAQWSPDGSRFGTAGYHYDGSIGNYTGRIVIFDAHSGTPLIAIAYPDDFPSGFVWLPDGQSVISAGKLIARWDANTGEPLHSLQSEVSLRDLMWAEDGRTLIPNPDPPALETIGMPTRFTSPDGTRIAVAISDMAHEPGEVMVLDANTQEQLYRIPTTGPVILDVEWSPDGSMLAISNAYEYGSMWNSQEIEEDAVQICDGWTGEELHRFIGHAADVLDVSWSPDGSLLASGSDDGTVLIWEVR